MFHLPKSSFNFLHVSKITKDLSKGRERLLQGFCCHFVLSISVMLAVFVVASIACLLALFWRRVFWLLCKPRCDFATHCAKAPGNAFEGRVCWVTGASSGIGEAVSRTLAARGAFVILTARREDALRAIARDMPEGRAVVLVADLSSQNAASLRELALRAASAFDDRLPRIDYLFNNAGVSTRATADGFDEENLRELMQVNFFTPVALTVACLPALRESRGVVVNISSIASILCTPLRSAYCASKAALSRWHECMRYEELDDDSFSIVNICPGSVRTRIAHNAFIGRRGAKFGNSDINIERGLDVVYVADRIVAAAHARICDCWIAGGKELAVTYIAYYAPALWLRIVPKMVMAYTKSVLGARSASS